MSIPRPNLHQQIVAANGKLTGEGLQLLDQMARTLRDMQARLSAAEATISDHETRITTLEP